jgi:hypothetical protein
MTDETQEVKPDPAELRDAGLRAFARGDFANAAQLLLPCAENGDVKAQMLLSRLYYAGNGVTADLDRYRYWLEKAAANGDKTARAKLKRLQ